MADIPATDLTPETSATLSGAEQFVMFDAVEGKRCTVDDLAAFLRLNKGCMERKYVRCNATTASIDRSGFNFKQDVPWPGMTADDHITASISAGTYVNTWGVESAADKAILWFNSQPATSLYVSIYREVTAST